LYLNAEQNDHQYFESYEQQITYSNDQMQLVQLDLAV
jgi:hypothetical protein